jgi:hypothetical protein
MTVDRASFDDLVTLVTQAPPWRGPGPGVRTLLRAIGRADPTPPTRSSPAGRGGSRGQCAGPRPRRAPVPGRKRLLGVAVSRGHRHEENAAKLAAAAELPLAPPLRCCLR